MEPVAGPRAPPRGTGLASGSSSTAPAPPLSPRQFLEPVPAPGAAGRSWPACLRCGDPAHFIDQCSVMEVGTLIRVPDAPDQADLYHILVGIEGGTYQALVDCMDVTKPQFIKV